MNPTKLSLKLAGFLALFIVISDNVKLDTLKFDENAIKEKKFDNLKLESPSPKLETYQPLKFSTLDITRRNYPLNSEREEGVSDYLQNYQLSGSPDSSISFRFFQF